MSLMDNAACATPASRAICIWIFLVGRYRRWFELIWTLAFDLHRSIAMAAEAGSYPDLKMLTLFGVGAILLRGAGCTVNDLLDRDIDGKVRSMVRE